MEATTHAFDSYAIVEIMGHVRLIGRVRRAEELPGMIRVDVLTPSDEGDGVSQYTRYYSPEAVFAITPLEEEAARKLATREDYDPSPLEWHEEIHLMVSDTRRAEHALVKAGKYVFEKDAVNDLADALLEVLEPASEIAAIPTHEDDEVGAELLERLSEASEKAEELLQRRGLHPNPEMPF